MAIETEGGPVCGFYVRTRSGTLVLTPSIIAELVEKKLVTETATEGEYEVDEVQEDSFWHCLRVR